MKTLIKNYTFDPLNKTIVVNDVAYLKLEDLLIVTNVTSNTIIYNFADPTCGGTVNGNVVTLAYDTTAMNSTDSLQIFVDIQQPETSDSELFPLSEQFTFDTNMNTVFGSNPVVDGGMVKSRTFHDFREVNGVLKGLNDEVSIDCTGCQTVVVQLSGSWTGVVTFDGRANNGDYYTIYGTPITSNYSVLNTLNGNNVTQFNVAGLKRFRVRFSTFTSGSSIIQLTATSALSRLANVTWDSNLNSVLGNVTLIRPGFFTVDNFSAPTINPTQPTSYPDNKYSTVPQRQPRLRVESGGSERLPFAQEPNTNKLLVYDELNRRLLEEILIELKTLNANFAVSNQFANMAESR